MAVYPVPVSPLKTVTGMTNGPTMEIIHLEPTRNPKTGELLPRGLTKKQSEYKDVKVMFASMEQISFAHPKSKRILSHERASPKFSFNGDHSAMFGETPAEKMKETRGGKHGVFGKTQDQLGPGFYQDHKEVEIAPNLKVSVALDRMLSTNRELPRATMTLRQVHSPEAIHKMEENRKHYPDTEGQVLITVATRCGSLTIFRSLARPTPLGRTRAFALGRASPRCQRENIYLHAQTRTSMSLWERGATISESASW